MMQSQLLKKPRGLNLLTDVQLWLIVIATFVVGIGLWGAMPAGYAQELIANPRALVSLLLLYPLVEELLFRGVIQPALLRQPILALRHAGVSRANLVTSILFAGLHLVNHSLSWAVAVLLPSLVLGHMFERYRHLAVPMCLHIFFNVTYVLAGAL